MAWSLHGSRHMTTSQQEELKDRVKAKQKELEARYHQIKADSRSDVRDERDRLKTKLEELQEMTREGWDRMSDSVRTKLNDWLKRD